MPLDGTTYRHTQQHDEVPAMLRRAKSLIRRHGWGQGRDGLCIYRAMRLAGSWRNWSDLGLPWPAEWQDEPGRTVEDVYAWLDEQIALREGLSIEPRRQAAE